MRTEQFLYFITVAEEGSFSKAAKKLFLSEPSLNKNITGFEKDCGFQLFTRSKRQLSLTAEGKLFLPHAKAIYSEIETSISEIRNQSAKESGILRINHVAVDSDEITDHVLARLKKYATSSQISQVILFEANPEHYRERLLEHSSETDVEVGVFCEDFSEDADLNVKILRELNETIVVPVDHPLAKKRKLTLDDLKGRNLVFTTNTPHGAHCRLMREIEHKQEFGIHYVYVNSISSGLKLTESSTNLMVKSSLYHVPEGFVAIPIELDFEPVLACIWAKKNQSIPLKIFLSELDKELG